MWEIVRGIYGCIKKVRIHTIVENRAKSCDNILITHDDYYNSIPMLLIFQTVIGPILSSENLSSPRFVNDKFQK